MIYFALYRKIAPPPMSRTVCDNGAANNAGSKLEYLEIAMGKKVAIITAILQVMANDILTVTGM